MSTPQETIQIQINEALKAGDKERVSTLRLLLAAIKNEKIRAGEEVDQDGFLKLVRKAIKQRKESAEQYRKGNREELAAKEEREAEILAAYLPPQVDTEELRSAIAALIESEGLAGPPAIGTIMRTMTAKYAGQTDGGTINKLARELLGV